ncbi:MAG: energy transducer TonB [Zoogloeaceae bacterium]|jgi:TonB family protein|nr:energy transducer TonB [Zoogloeaceae bacterium]
MQDFHKDARLAQMLLFSVLAHVLLLSIVRLPPPYLVRSGEELTVSLRAEAPSFASASPSAPSAVPSASLAVEPEVTPPPLRRLLDTPRPAAPPRPLASPERASAHVEAIAAPAGVSEEAAEATDAGEASQVLSEGVGKGGDTNGQATEGMADALPAYLIAIGDNARKLRRYPERARALGHEGRVDIRLIWRPGMSVPHVELQRGSGSALLDRQGLNMLRQAAIHTPMPEDLRQRAFSLVLPVEFSLEQRE